MTDRAKAEEVARGLTKAQRRAILLQSCTGPGKWSCRNALVRKGLASEMPLRLTDMGHAVRAVIQAHEGEAK